MENAPPILNSSNRSSPGNDNISVIEETAGRIWVSTKFGSPASVKKMMSKISVNRLRESKRAI